MRKLTSIKFITILLLSLFLSIDPVEISSAQVSSQAVVEDYAPGRLIVKFKNLDACAQCLLSAGERFSNHLPDKSESLDILNAANNVMSARGLFIKRHGLNAEQALEKQNQTLNRSALTNQTRLDRNTSVNSSNDFTSIYVLEVPPDSDIKAIAEQYSNDPNVVYATPDYIAKPTIIPNDPGYINGYLYGHDLIQTAGSSTSAWDINTGDGIVVAVVDTGVDYTHEDIAANIWQNDAEANGVQGIDDDGNGYIDDIRGFDFTECEYLDEFDQCINAKPKDNDPMDNESHGTHVAGTIAAIGNNNIGIIGVAPDAKIMPLKGLSDQNGGYTIWLAEAIRYAADNGADVINNSWGGGSCSAPPYTNPIVEDAVLYAHGLGVVVVFSAGNADENVLCISPKNMKETITVAASDELDLKAIFSNYGHLVDVAAPGVNIVSLLTTAVDPANLYYPSSGTSMAAPHVSGLAALILSNDTDASLSNEDVKKVIRASADDIESTDFDLRSGSGRINALNALAIDQVLNSEIESNGSFLDVNISEPTFTINGTASGLNFNSYQLYYREVIEPDLNPSAWLPVVDDLGDSNPVFNPVTNGILRNWDITGLTEGDYLLKLDAEDTNGNIFHDVVLVNAEIQAVPADVSSPVPGSQITSNSVLFTWDPGVDNTEYFLGVGTSFEAVSTAPYGDIHAGPYIPDTMVQVNSIPLEGNTIFVRLWSRGSDNSVSFRDYQYLTSTDDLPVIADLISPTPGSKLNLGAIDFNWSAGQNISQYFLGVGTSFESISTPPYGDIVNGPWGDYLSASVDIPQNVNIVYARLWSRSNDGKVFFNDYTFNGPDYPAEITSHTSGERFLSADVTFDWSTGNGVSEYWLKVGSSVGAEDIYNSSQGLLNNVDVTIPDGVETVYVQLLSNINNVWEIKDYYFEAHVQYSELISHTDGETLDSYPVQFEWSKGVGIGRYFIGVGTTQESLTGYPFGDIYGLTSGSTWGDHLMANVNLPLDGSQVYVRLWSREGTNGPISTVDYVFNSVNLPPSPAQMISHIDGATLVGSPIQFDWNAGVGMGRYFIGVGSSPDTLTGYPFGDIYGINQGSAWGTAQSASINVPQDGNPIYVRLWSREGTSGPIHTVDYTFQTTRVDPVPAQLISHIDGATISNSPVTFEWDNGIGMGRYFLGIATSPDLLADPPYGDIYGLNQGSSWNALKSATLNIDLDGNPIYVRLWSREGTNGPITTVDYQFNTQFIPPTPATLVNYADGDTLSESPVTFTWDEGVGMGRYFIGVGTTPESLNTPPFGDVYGLNNGSQWSSELSATVNFSLDGNPLYVRLWSREGVSGPIQTVDYMLNTLNVQPEAAQMISPVPGSSIGGDVLFEWDNGKNLDDLYFLGVGTSLQSVQNYPYGNIFGLTTGSTWKSGNSQLIENFPLDGGEIYVRLWSRKGTTIFTNTYNYSGFSQIPTITSPVDGSCISASVVTFNWIGSWNVDNYQFNVGTTPGGNDLYSESAGTQLSAVVTGIPVDGSNVYTELVSNINGSQVVNSAVYSTGQCNDPPVAVAQIIGPSAGFNNITFNFDASGSSDPDGDQLAYIWDFGDGSSGSGLQTSHQFSSPGNYTVTLIVRDPDGLEDTDTVDITVVNRDPVAEFEVIGGNLFGFIAQNIEFDASLSYDPDGDPLTYSWDFGDGNNGTGINPVHTFSDIGLYDVVLIVSDPHGGSDSFSVQFEIRNRPPVAISTMDPPTGFVDTVFTFDGSDSYDPDGHAITCVWEFSDNQTLTGCVVQRTFPLVDNYRALLKVTDSFGLTSDAPVLNFDIQNRPPVADAQIIGPAENMIETIITFDGSLSSDPDNQALIYEWDFGDGGTGVGVQVNHAFNLAGVYTITLTVSDPFNLQDQDTVQFTAVATGNPTADPRVLNGNTGTNDKTFIFDGSLSFDPEGDNIIGYDWDFGDGQTAQGVGAQHSYTDPGVYTVVLTVTDENGLKGSANLSIDVQNRDPIAVISVGSGNNFAQVNEPVSFDASGSSDLDQHGLTYFWQFGDGATSALVDPVHTYNSPGNYQIILLVSDAFGGGGNAVLNFEVFIPASLVSPAQGTVLDDTEMFTWSGAVGSIENYAIIMGDGVGEKNYYDSGNLDSAQTFDSISNIPQDGSTVWVRLSTRINGIWLSNDYSFITEADVVPLPDMATLTSHVDGELLTDSPVNFMWNDGNGTMSVFFLGVSTTQAGLDVFPFGDIHGVNTGEAWSSDQSQIVDVPLTGNPVYVRVWSRPSLGSSDIKTVDYVLNTVVPPPLIAAELTSHVDGDTLSSSPVTFEWDSPNDTAGYFFIGVGLSQASIDNFPYGDVYGYGTGSTWQVEKSVTIDVPIVGAPLYVRLFTRKDLSSSEILSVQYVFNTSSVIASASSNEVSVDEEIEEINIPESTVNDTLDVLVQTVEPVTIELQQETEDNSNEAEPTIIPEQHSQKGLTSIVMSSNEDESDGYYFVSPDKERFGASLYFEEEELPVVIVSAELAEPVSVLDEMDYFRAMEMCKPGCQIYDFDLISDEYKELIDYQQYPEGIVIRK